MRFDGKVLAKIHDKPLIQYVYENASQAKLLDDLIVATDDERVMRAVQGFGGKAVLTAKEHKSGTDRLWEAVSEIDTKVVVNIQGDEPLLHFTMIDDLAKTLLQDPVIKIATIIKKIEIPAEITDPNVVKVVFDKDGFALYFSRSPIPYESTHKRLRLGNYYKHIGLYAYTKDFLFTFINLGVSALEESERLEQLRVLEHGFAIKVIETDYDTIGVDTPGDLEKVKERLKPNCA